VDGQAAGDEGRGVQQAPASAAGEGQAAEAAISPLRRLKIARLAVVSRFCRWTAAQWGSDPDW